MKSILPYRCFLGWLSTLGASLRTGTEVVATCGAKSKPLTRACPPPHHYPTHRHYCEDGSQIPQLDGVFDPRIWGIDAQTSINLQRPHSRSLPRSKSVENL